MVLRLRARFVCGWDGYGLFSLRYFCVDDLLVWVSFVGVFR